MSEQIEETKKCPFCAETIKAGAIVCRFCGRDLKSGATPAAQPVQVNVRLPAAKKTGCSPLTLILLFLIGIALLIGGLSSSGQSSPSAGSSSKSTYTITYRVSGTGTSKASVTYQNATGDTEQADIALPWTKTFTAKSGAFLYISAQNDRDTGTIKCEILVETTVAKQSQSSGAYVIATCSGRL